VIGLLNLPARLLLAGAAVGLVLAWGQWRHHTGRTAGRAEVQARWDADKLVRSTKALETIKEYRNEEARRQSETAEAVAQARRRADLAQRDADAARAAAVGLHNAATAFAAACDRPAADTAAAAGSAPAAGPGLVLADVLRGSDDTSGDLARAFDAARAAGLACERIHDAMTQPKEPPP
jgi:hypothetical protein